jgi:hypothetical protein
MDEAIGYQKAVENGEIDIDGEDPGGSSAPPPPRQRLG